MEWKPIETAPKDGTEILISSFIRNNPIDGRFVAIAIYNEHGVFGANEMDDIGYYPPTHWMHLPEPPQADGE